MLESQPFYKIPKNQRAIISFCVIFVLILAFNDELRYISNTIITLIRTYLFGQQAVLLPRNNIILSVYILLFAAITFILFNIFLLFLISSYLLPIQNIKEQIQVLYRLILYDLRMHGPAIFIKSGYIVAKAEELSRPGQGVIMVDSSSAVIIERKSYVQSSNPGTSPSKKDKKNKKKPENTTSPNYRVEGP